MALILTNYDLTGGETRTTSTITEATYVESQVLLGTVAGRVMYYPERKQSTGDWIPITDGLDNVIAWSTLDEVEAGRNLVGLTGNAGSTFSIRVKPLGAASGTISIDAVTDGTIA